MLLSLLTLTSAALACQWEATNLDWRWTGELSIPLSRAGSPALVSVFPGAFSAVTVSLKPSGLTVRVTEGPVTVWGTAATFSALHPAGPLELGDGLRYGPQASVGVAAAGKGKVGVQLRPPAGARPYAPDKLPQLTVACEDLTLQRAEFPVIGDDRGGFLLVKERAVVVYASPGGARVGQYPADTGGKWGPTIGLESDEFVDVVERKDGFARIVDDRTTWRLEAWVREEDIVTGEPPELGLIGGMLGSRPAGARCISPGPLYVVDSDGEVWEVGEVGAVARVDSATPVTGSGYNRVTLSSVGNIRPASGTPKRLAFAVESERVVACPP